MAAQFGPHWLDALVRGYNKLGLLDRTAPFCVLPTKTWPSPIRAQAGAARNGNLTKS